MTIVQISDTHNCHRQLANLPAADVLVHCGDFTDMGTEQEVLDFLNWLIELPYKHKVLLLVIMTFVYGKQLILRGFLATCIFFRIEVVR